ncbi:ribbon-helix-helix domain-containing protein [Patulibacter sp. NPDC049589]|uniref:ribbon-helix-helix domain-containing protein n=1 Tax=Patulibacter sp. NPDC049589 TaxID=3154731 RepID=UPI003446FD61
MKVSVSLSEDDVAELDRFARSSGLPSRSAAVQHAIRLLRSAGLEQDYAEAWDDWESSGDRALWEPSTGDGVRDAER